MDPLRTMPAGNGNITSFKALIAAAEARWQPGVVTATTEPYGAAVVVLERHLRAQTEPHDARAVELLGQVVDAGEIARTPDRCDDAGVEEVLERDLPIVPVPPRPLGSDALIQRPGRNRSVVADLLLEELVGEITDEYEEIPPEPIKQIDADTLDVDARTYIDDLNDEFELNLPEDPSIE